MATEIDEKIDDKKNRAVCLGNLAYMAQIPLGELDDAESNLRRRIEISREIKDESRVAIGHQELGRLLAYRGEFLKSEEELAKSTGYWKETDEKQYIRLDEAYRSLRSLLMSNDDKALKSAIKARELAEISYTEKNIIRAEYLLGAAHLMKGNLVEADKHLTEALTRDRKINLVELEPDILLEFAKLRLKQNYKKEALKYSEEALQIADRCEYRLKQADIHNFLAEFYLAAGKLEEAREHGETAKERAACGYKPALEKAEKMLKEIERR